MLTTLHYKFQFGLRNATLKCHYGWWFSKGFVSGVPYTYSEWSNVPVFYEPIISQYWGFYMAHD